VVFEPHILGEVVGIRSLRSIKARCPYGQYRRRGVCAKSGSAEMVVGMCHAAVRIP